jgi:hypothetical protein
MRLFSIATAALVLVSTLGCRRQQASDTSGTLDTALTPTATATPETSTSGTGDFTFDRRQEFSQSVQQQLAEIDQEIAGLAAQVKSKGGAVSDRAVANIRASRRSLDRTLGRVDAATADNWEQIREGVNQAVENLNESIDAAQPK